MSTTTTAADDRTRALAWVREYVPNLQDDELQQAFARWYARKCRKRLAWVDGPDALAQFYLCWEQGVTP